MARFLFTVIPALGHINPTMPVAVELRQRGHEVAYCVGEDFRRAIEVDGLGFYPSAHPGLLTLKTSTNDKMLQHTGLLSHYYFFRGLAELNRDDLGPVRSAAEKFNPDVIVADSFTYAGAQTAELLGVPWATYSSVPGLIPTRDAPPFTTWGLPQTENILLKTAYRGIRIGQGMLFRFFDPMFNRIRTSAGLRPVSQYALKGCLSPYLIMIPSCEGFEYKRSDWPPQAHMLGPAPWGKSPGNDRDFSWIDELPRDRPVIYTTIGTVQVHRSLKFFNIVIEALRQEHCSAVLSVGNVVDRSIFSNVPGHFRIEPFVPHAKILPRATAVIHHGGQGIAQDSIYYGLPAVVVPISQDLYEIAQRCRAAGVAERIPYPRLTPERLREAVRNILGSNSIRQNTLRLQKIFLGTHAGRTGATLLEELYETKAPVLQRA